MAAPEYDVLIIGAGAAGLAAAAEVAAKGELSALVLEARDRVGGRIWTRRKPGLAVPIELGAEFIHGRMASTFDLLREAGSAALDTPEEHWLATQGRLRRMDETLFREIRRYLARSGIHRRRDVPFAELIAGGSRHGLSPRAKLFARMMVEGFDAADPARVSGRSIAEEWRSGGPTDTAQFRPQGGYAGSMEVLRRRLAGSKVRLQLQTVVDTVRWRADEVELQGRFLGTPFRTTASKAIVTLPLGVLQQPDGAPGAVRFSPALDSRRPALQSLVAGPVVKLVLHFCEAFWEQLGGNAYENGAFFHSPDAAFPTCWSALPARAPLLVAWAGGPKARDLAGLKPAEIRAHALASVSKMFGLPRKGRRSPGAMLQGAWYHDWQEDVFARGAYSYVATGGEAARKALARHVESTLFFAGEATDEDNAGTVAGALADGVRAAKEVSASFRARERRRTRNHSPIVSSGATKPAG